MDLIRIALAFLDRWAKLLPTRIDHEEVGDRLEHIALLVAQHQPKRTICAAVVSTCFWTLAHSIAHVVSEWARGRSSAKRATLSEGAWWAVGVIILGIWGIGEWALNLRMRPIVMSYSEGKWEQVIDTTPIIAAVPIVPFMLAGAFLFLTITVMVSRWRSSRKRPSRS
jgi:hypothetical protein